MKIEIYSNKKKIKSHKKSKLNMKMIEPDFNSINKLRGNKIVLEFLFQNQKLESLKNG